MFDRVRMLKENGKLLILIPNYKNAYNKFIYDFQGEFAHRIGVVINSGYHVDRIDNVCDDLTLLGAFVGRRVNNVILKTKIIGYLLYASLGLPGAIFCILRNGFFGNIPNRKNGHCTNILVTLSPSDTTRRAYAK